MSSTFVTLAEVLEARGGPLLEEEVWSLLVGTAEALIDVSYKGKNISCPSPLSSNLDEQDEIKPSRLCRPQQHVQHHKSHLLTAVSHGHLSV